MRDNPIAKQCLRIAQGIEKGWLANAEDAKRKGYKEFTYQHRAAGAADVARAIYIQLLHERKLARLSEDK